MSFDLSQYSTVAERIDAFTKEYPNFRINSEVFDVIIEGVAVIRVKVSVYKDAPDDYPWSVGWAQERATKAFALELTETSAYGRSLANAGYASKLGTPRPSVEEMRTVTPRDTGVTVTTTADVNPDVWNTPFPSHKTAEEWGEVDTHENTARPTCSHGPMLSQGGVSAAGKKLPLWKCSEVDRDSQCKAIWA